MIALWLMAALLIKHFALDFPLQTKNMLAEKGEYLAIGGVNHAFAHGVGTALVFMLFGMSALAGTLAVLDILIHYHVDYLKMKINSKAGLTTQDTRFWNLLGLDQLAHHMTYVLLVYLALTVSSGA